MITVLSSTDELIMFKDLFSYIKKKSVSVLVENTDRGTRSVDNAGSRGLCKTRGVENADPGVWDSCRKRGRVSRVFYSKVEFMFSFQTGY